MCVVRINQIIDNINMIIYICHIYNDIVFNSLVVFFLIAVCLSIYLCISMHQYMYIYVYHSIFNHVCKLNESSRNTILTSIYDT